MSKRMLLYIAVASILDAARCYNLDVSAPLMYRYPRHTGRGTYFGMSVAIRPQRTLDNSWVFQVGTPRGNVTGVNVEEPGTLYRCRLYGPCTEYVVDNGGNTPGVNYLYRYKDRKNEAWVGASMDIRAVDEEAKTVVCGSRWCNQNLTNDDNIGVTYLMAGVCYIQDVCRNCTTESPTYKLLPLVNPSKIYYPKPYAFDKSYYYWGLGQAGFSSTLLDDLSAVIMGAPGYNNWLGTVIQYSTDLRMFDFRVGLFEHTKEFKRNSYPYIGYQVTFGRFFSDKKLWLVAGAPRAENYHGKVLLFQFKEPTSHIQIISERVGDSFGEYFGSSLTVSDINNDGFDDLVVGAPLFFRKHPEEGRIYVFLGTSRGSFLFRSQVINGLGAYSRFGTCLANLGDLDQDGYRDIAVGAPYENDGRGAVYIHRGSKKGLEMEFSQRILARDIHYGLRGFGISMSGGIDIDGNRYNDLAVGAYLSDDVVLFRSRPIIHLHPVIRLEEITTLDRKATMFNISVCSRYSGSNTPRRVRIIRTVDIDANRNRAYIAGTTKSVEKNAIHLVMNEMRCEILSITINSDGSSYEPVLINLKSELPPCSTHEPRPLIAWERNTALQDTFEKWCPIGRKKETSIEVPFAGECGADNTCQAELELSCEILHANKMPYIVVTSDFITLSIDLRNMGEPAHNTVILVTSNIDLISNDYVDGSDENIPRRTFLIDVGSTFVKNFHANFSFRIATDSPQFNDTSEWVRITNLKLRVEAHSKSVEDFFGDNMCDINLNLLSDATVELYSSSTVTSSFDLKNTTELNFTLYYEVQKTGETPVLDGEINIFIPSYIDAAGRNVEFATVKVETSDWIYSSINDEEYKEWVGPSEVDIVWHNLNSTNVSLPFDRTVFLNCSTSGFRCRTISVVFPDGIPSKISSQIKIFVTLSLEAIAHLLTEKDIIHFTSAGILEYKKLLELEQLQIISHSSVTFYKEEEAKQVELYVIALSVIAGALLLFVIICALVKSEFFRRKKKEELQALKTEELRRQSQFEFPSEIVEEVEEDCDGAMAKE